MIVRLEFYIKLIYNIIVTKKYRRKEQRMIVTGNLKYGGSIEVRIENGQIYEVTYKGNTVTREEKDTIQYWLKFIFKEDLEKFKEILNNIRPDEDYFSAGKALLDAEKERRKKVRLDYERECKEKLLQMQKEEEKYTL